MERKLMEHDQAEPEYELGESWHYSINDSGQRFTQHVFHYLAEDAYRTRIFRHAEDQEQELWAFEQGQFKSLEEALELGARVVKSWLDKE